MRLGVVLGCLWNACGVLGRLGCVLTSSWRHLGGVLGRLGGVFFGVVQKSWAVVGASCVVLGPLSPPR